MAGRQPVQLLLQLQLLLALALAMSMNSAAADTIAGCTPGAACTVSADIVLAGTTALSHDADLTIAAGKKVECLANFCRLDFAVNGTLRLEGLIRAPIVVVEVSRLDVIGGLVDASELGGVPGAGAGGGATATSSSGGGGGYGGVGMDGCAVPHPKGGSKYGSATEISEFMGSGGGNSLDATSRVAHAGGRGGGVVRINVKDIHFSAGGSIKTNGQHGFSNEHTGISGGGGSGGSIILSVTGSFIQDPSGGQLFASGGSSTRGTVVPGGTAGGGGGGRIHIVSAFNSIPDNLDTIAAGGSSECGLADHGSVYKAEGRRQCVREGNGDFVCTCQDGWSGSLCDVCAADRFGPECQFQCPDCGSHGACSRNSTAGAKACTCDQHWDGLQCNECAANWYSPDCSKLCVYCGVHARCQDGTTGDGACVCSEGWAGAACDDCDNQHWGPNCDKDCEICGTHGTCKSGLAGNGQCMCATGWTGDNCDKCATGFYGPQCQFQCADCGINAFCSDGFNGTGCTCTTEWNRNAPSDPCTECQTGYYGSSCAKCDDCGDHGDCHDGKSGTGQCQCDPGFYGLHCENKCPQCTIHGTCNDGRTGNGACVCATGWAGDLCHECQQGYYGPTCTSTCTSCTLHAVCDNGFDSIGCVCATGWRRAADGQPCDLCAPRFYGSLCEPCPDCGAHGTCGDGLAGNGRCTCDDGWYGLLCNNTCTDCSGHGSCKDGRNGDGSCVCSAGFTGAQCNDCAAGFYGPQCQYECPNCGLNSQCSSGKNGTGCVCSPGWRKSSGSTTCDECDTGHFGSTCAACPDCGPHGTCNDGASGDGTCTCSPGWATPGSGAPCSVCKAGFFGDSCTGECPSCSSGKVCSDGVRGTGLCICPGGWSGKDCDVCSPSWTGTQCNECAAGHFSKSCVKCKCAHGDCEDGMSGSGACTCPSGGPFLGPMCSRCKEGFWGKDCTACSCNEAISRCDDGESGTGECKCLSGFQGLDCTEKASELFCLTSSPSCVPGQLDLQYGYDIVAGVLKSAVVYPIGMPNATTPTRTLNTITYAVSAAVETTQLEGAMYTTSLQLVGTRSEAQAYALRHKLGLSAASGANLQQLGAALDLNSELDALEESISGGRFGAGLSHNVELFRATRGSDATAKQFRDDIADLPRTYDATAYKSFVNKYGTHVVTSVTVGARVELFATAGLCTEYASLLTDKDAAAALELALAGGDAASLLELAGTYQGLQARMVVVGGSEDDLQATGLAAWEESVKAAPEVIGYGLTPIVNVVQDTVARAHLSTYVDSYYAAHASASSSSQAKLDDNSERGSCPATGNAAVATHAPAMLISLLLAACTLLLLL